MKNFTSIIFLILLPVFFASQLPSTPKADFQGVYDWWDSLKPAPKNIKQSTVIENYITAIGGEKSWDDVKKMKIVYEDTVSKLFITKYLKHPNLYCKITHTDSVVFEKLIFDGTRGIKTDLLGTHQLNSKENLQLKVEAMLHPAEQLSKRGYKLIGMVKIDGKNTYCLESKKPKHIFDFYSATNFLKVRTITTYQKNSTDTDTLVIDYSNYIDVNGKQFPYRLKMSTLNESVELRVTDLKINIGTGIHKGMFETK